MNFYNKKWNDYIYDDWKYHVKCISFFADYNSNNIEVYDGDYDVKLREQFDKYYNAKKLYISMYDKLREEFGDYEEIEILDYYDEFIQYKDMVESYANELMDTIKKNIGLNKFDEFKDIDFNLLLLGYVDSNNYNKIIKYYKKIFNRANGFLSGGYENNEYLKKYIDNKLFDIWFHDCILEDIKVNNDNIILVIEDGYYPYDKIYYLTLEGIVSNDINKDIIPFDILGFDIYFNNNKFYLYIDESYLKCYELVCSNIKLDIRNK